MTVKRVVGTSTKTTSTQQQKRKRDDYKEILELFKQELLRVFSSFKFDQDSKISTILSSMKEIKEQNLDILKIFSENYDELLSRVNDLESKNNQNQQYIHILETKIESLE